MEQKELSLKLKESARAVGLCDQWFSEWKDEESQQTLIDKYLRGIDFVIMHNFPPQEFVAHFDKDLRKKNNIFIDEWVGNCWGSPVVINGECEGKMTYDGTSTSTLYIRNNSKISIVCEDISKLWIHVYDKAQVTVIAKNAAKAYIYKHSADCQLQFFGNVIVRNKVE